MEYRLIAENRKGIFIKESELKLLKMIFNQRIVTSEQIGYWLGLKSKTEFANLRRRLTKFTAYRLLVRNKYPLVDGIFFYYYRIGSKGISILKELDLITAEESSYSTYKRIGQPAHMDHLLATQQVVIQVVKDLEQANVESHYPYASLFLRNKDDNKPFLVPDWVLSCQKKRVYIELDTGSERMSDIEHKMSRYYEWACMNPDQEHNVFFVSLDESFRTTKFYGDRRRRIGNLRKGILDTEEGKKVPHNLNVFSVSLKRAPKIIQKVLKGEIPLQADNKKHRLRTGLDVLIDMNNCFPYNFTEVSEEDYYKPSAPASLRLDLIYDVYREGVYVETVGMIYLEEGLVSTLRKLDYANLQIEGRLDLKKPIHRLIGIYETSLESQHDVLGIEYNNLLIADHETWDKDYESQPIFYKQTSSANIVEVTYDL